MSNAPPLRLTEPARGSRLPLVFDSPHSGRDYPAAYAPLVPIAELYGYEDRLVDDLLTDAPAYGVPLLAAGFPRSFVDPNRADDDLDQLVTGESWAGPARPSVYSQRGQGLIFRVGLDGRPLYAGPLALEEVEARIALYWRPYHDALEKLLSAAQTRWGAVWHINWHSMRPVGDALAPDPGAARPAFVIGDLDGRSAEPAFSDAAEQSLRELGYHVARNRPFKGGYITERHGRPEQGRHSIQIEINRGLYLDAGLLEPGRGMARLRADLAHFTAVMAAFVRERLG